LGRSGVYQQQMTTTGSEPHANTAEGTAPTALVCLHGPLRKLAGGSTQHRLEGATVAELLRALESRHPDLRGWILDERGRIRRHINVFVAGQQAGEQAAVRDGDRVEVLPAITGG
jgi:sulfur-carrier protein